MDARRDGHDPPPGAIPPAQAIALGAVQGPAELLPVSSSAHLSLIPWLGNWGWEAMDPDLRQGFEVALHAGGAAALLLGQRRVIAEELASFDARRAVVLLLSSAPAALIGFALEGRIARRLGGPRATAAGLALGALVMIGADRRPQLRGRGEAGAIDGIALGLAQAAALAPGVSRNGATLAAARWRCFTRAQANMLSRTVALPVIVAAAALKSFRLRRIGLSSRQARAFAAGTGASFASTLASQALIRLVERDRALWPYAAYRAGLAALVLAKLGRDGTPSSAVSPLAEALDGASGVPSGALVARGPEARS